MKRRTQQAMTYLQVIRRRSPDPDATWFDVARAYDAGLQSAVENRRAAVRALAIADRPEEEEPTSTVGVVGQ